MARRPCRGRARTKGSPFFYGFLGVLALLTLLGLTRVSLAARAAEAAVDADSLRSQIKAAGIEQDALEIDKGVLSTPSRLQEIASGSMHMAEPSQVLVMRMPSAVEPTEVSPEPEMTPAALGVREIAGALMDMAAGEAQVLLVGDAGLSSTR